MAKVVPNQKKYVSYNEEGEVSEFDLSQCPDLEEFYCSYLQLTHLDVSKCPKLEILYCSGNSLTELDLSQTPNLKFLHCDDNKLTELDLSQNPNLKFLHCEDNKLTELDLSQSPYLEEINCKNNVLKKLDISGCYKLKFLICNYNQITVLEVLNCPKLTKLQCNDNKLTTLVINNCPKLEMLDCRDNNLDKLPELPNSLSSLQCFPNPFLHFTLPNNFSQLSLQVQNKIIETQSSIKQDFFKREYINVFRGFDFGDLQDKFDKIITQREFEENNIRVDSFKLTNCKGGINPSYFQKAVKNLFNNNDFDGVCCLKNDKIIGFCIVEKGECRNYPHFYPINLICSEGIARILLCFYIYCCNQNNYSFGLLELAKSITNKAGYIAYTKVGFYYDYKDAKLNCFDVKRNLQMKVLTNKIDNNFYDILSGKKKYTNKFIAENFFDNSKMDMKTFENIRTDNDMNALEQTIANGNFDDIVEEYDNILEKMQNLYIIDNTKAIGGRRKKTKKQKKRLITKTKTKKHLVK